MTHFTPDGDPINASDLAREVLDRRDDEYRTTYRRGRVRTNQPDLIDEEAGLRRVNGVWRTDGML